MLWGMEDQELAQLVISAIVEHPDDVRIDRSIDEMGVLLTINVNPGDLGQVIGRVGVMAQALRTIFRAIGAKKHSHLSLKIAEPQLKRAAPVAGLDDPTSTKF